MNRIFHRAAAVDLWTIGYVAFSTGWILLHWHARSSMMAMTCLLPVACVALLAIRARCAGSASAVVEFYPVLLTLALYTEVGWSNRTIGSSHDALVAAWEQHLFGFQPSLTWMTAWPHPVVSTIFHLSYVSYYLIVIGTPVVLWFSGRKDAARRTILIMMVTFYVCYTAFRFFPVAGPRYLFPLQDSPAIHAALPAFAHKLVAGGSAWGTAFPSSHVAVAFVNAANAWRSWRAFGVAVWILAILLALGTVYGQFHYAVDALAGAAVASFILGLTANYWK